MAIPSATDVLLQQAMLDAQDKPDPAVAMGVGAGGGALLGILAGTPLHMGGKAINAMKDSLAAQQGLSRGIAQKMRGSIRPGFRAAGGLLGAIAGGALGAGMANMMKQSSPAGNILARIQATNGQLSSMEQLQLEQVLKDYYNNMA